jgi:hypothetical protein
MVVVSFLAVMVPLLAFGRLVRELSMERIGDHWGREFEERWEFPLLGRDDEER